MLKGKGIQGNLRATLYWLYLKQIEVSLFVGGPKNENIKSFSLQLVGVQHEQVTLTIFVETYKCRGKKTVPKLSCQPDILETFYRLSSEDDLCQAMAKKTKLSDVSATKVA